MIQFFMKSKVLFLALSTMSLATSCSNDEVTEFSDNQTIKFNVNAGMPTRAADIYCNYNKPKAFKLWASYTKGGSTSTFINNDKITSSDGNTWTNESGTRYWPEDGTLKFFAHVNADNEFNWNEGAPIIKDFTVPTNVSVQKDLLYAITEATGKTATDKTKDAVAINFRHALSQIVFQAKNTNKNLYVEIYGVSVMNVADKGTYTYSTDATTGNINDHSGSGSYESAGRGNWKKDNAAITGGTQDYSVSFPKVSMKGGEKDGANDKVYPLTTTADTDGEGIVDPGFEKFNSNALMLIPQTTTKWDLTTTTKESQTYFKIKCNIYNYVEESGSESKVLLWGVEGSGKDAAIPVQFTWEEGKKYIYTFNFGTGNGGVDPENPENPVLIPIDFTVTVDDFVNADEEVDMDAQL